MNERQCILIVDDDRGITEGLAFAMEADGRTVVICSDVEAAEVALSAFPVTHLVTDLQFSGAFGFEGLHFLTRVRTTSPQCRVVLITGFVTDALRAEALQHGAAAVLAKPFAIPELEAALGAAPAASNSGYELIRFPSIEQILRDDTLGVAFQPIVRLSPTGTSTFAFEALTRARGNWLLGGPAMVFEYAERRNKLEELNLVAMSRALTAASALPPDASVFINIDPQTFAHRELSATLRASAFAAGVALDRVVLEVTERSSFAHDANCNVFDELRAAGVRFALDDHGSAYSHLGKINRIQPSFIKISNTFGTGFEGDETKQRIVRHTVALARDFGCETILEGIETVSTARAAAEAGVPLAQGYHFGRAREASHWNSWKSVLRAA